MKRAADVIIRGLDVVTPAARQIGEQIGNALASGLDMAVAKARQLREVLSNLPAVTPVGGNSTPGLRDAEAETLRLAQARARLQSANGDFSAAERTLKDALAATTRETAATLNAERQLVGIQAQTKTAAGQSEAAILREAQALARLRQAAGDAPGAIKALDDALKKVSNPSSLAAVRAEIQKTYLTTNYQNSPLIGAIRDTNKGLESLLPVAGRVGGALTGIFGGFLGGLVGGGILGTFESLARTALNAAIELDKNRQTLVALTGSAALANQKLAELRNLAQNAPGLTASLAVTGFAQLKAAGNVADETINNLLKGFGKLNAIFTIEDPKKFFGNLVQIFTQGFSERDIKEAVRAIPIFRTILQEAFGTSDPGKLRELQHAGKLTLDSYLSGLAQGIESNPVLQNVQESIGVKLEKTKDRITTALAPIGEELAKGLLGFADGLAKQLEQSQVEIRGVIAAVEDLGGVFANLGQNVPIHSLSDELHDLKEFIDFITGGVVLLEDVIELAAAFVVKVIKEAVFVIESTISGFFSLFGIKIDALENDMQRLANDIVVIDQRLSEGLKNTDEFFRRKRERDLVVDVGNAVPTDPNNPGKPLLPQVNPAAGAGDFKTEHSKRISLLLQEQREVAKLQQQVDALEKGNGFGKLFELEVKKNELQETKNQLNEIIKLRRLLDLDVKAPLPIGKDARETVLRDLNREKQTREAILRLQDAQADAEAKLRIARATAAAPVVTADVRAQTAIAEAEAARRNANEQNLADTIAAQDKINKLDDERLRFLSEAIVAEQARAVVATKAAKEQLIAEQARFKVLQDGELVSQQFAAEAAAARLKASNDAKATILRNEATLKEGLIEFELDVARARSDQQVKRLQETRETAVQLKLIEEDIAKLRAGDAGETARALNSADLSRAQETARTLQQLIVLRKEASLGFTGTEFVTSAQEKAEASRLEAMRSAAQEIITLQDQIAHAGEDSAQRQQVAYLRAIKSIKDADAEARDQIIKSQVEIADKTIFHADRSNAAVLEHLNKQTKGITEIVSDSKIRLIDDVFSAADRGIEKLTARLGIFKGFIQEILSGLARMILSRAFQSIFGLSGGGGAGGGFGFAGGGSSGGSGFNVGGLLSGLFGANRSGSSFLTPGFAGGNPAAAALGGNFNLGSLVNLLGAGGGIGVAPSVSLPSIPADSALGRAALGRIFGGQQQQQVPQGLFDKLFGGIFGNGLISPLPALLGLGIGSGLGGPSTIGKILGSLGGGAVGLGASFGAAVFGAGGGLGQAALAFLGPAALLGLPLLIGAFLFGRAAQRRKDESSSGDALQQAVDKIHGLRDQIKSDQLKLTESDAKKLLEDDIIAPFIAFINTLKTRSVRESRLAHQVPDLRHLWEVEVLPEIQAQQLRIKNQQFGLKLIPEFATGGVVNGIDRGYDSVLAMLRPREMVLTLEQQTRIATLAGQNVFAMAGVPGVGHVAQPSAQPIQPFQTGGVVQPFAVSSPQPSAAFDGPVVVQVDEVRVMVGSDDASEIVFVGARTAKGKRGLRVGIKDLRRDGDI